MHNKRVIVCAVTVLLASASISPVACAFESLSDSAHETASGVPSEVRNEGRYEVRSVVSEEVLKRPASSQQLVGSEAFSLSISPDLLARQPIRELQLGNVRLMKRLSAGFTLREDRDELSIPDLGSSGTPASGFDAGSVAQDIHASSNRLQGQFPRKSALRMNFLKFDNEDFRMDVTQHPSRTGLRFHHLGTGLRIEAERRYINSSTSVFVGVRLLEDRMMDPTIGCSMQSSAKNAFETRNFCGFRLRISL